jgi:hypothetical protein
MHRSVVRNGLGKSREGSGSAAALAASGIEILSVCFSKSMYDSSTAVVVSVGLPARMFHGFTICFTICLFISRDLDGSRAPKTRH